MTMTGRKPWASMTEQERRLVSAERMSAIDDLVEHVLEHRGEDCDLAPLCPGREVADKLEQVPTYAWGDLMAGMLCALADRATEIAVLHGELGHASDRADRSEQAVKRLEIELAEARKDADTGWAAYHSTKPKAQGS